MLSCQPNGHYSGSSLPNGAATGNINKPGKAAARCTHAKTAIDLLGDSIYLSQLTLPLATKEWNRRRMSCSAATGVKGSCVGQSDQFGCCGPRSTGLPARRRAAGFGYTSALAAAGTTASPRCERRATNRSRKSELSCAPLGQCLSGGFFMRVYTSGGHERRVFAAKTSRFSSREASARLTSPQRRRS